MSSTIIQYNNINITSTQDVNGILLTQDRGANNIRSNYINITGKNVNIIQILTNTTPNKITTLYSNILIGNGLNVTGFILMGVINSGDNNININGSNITGVLFINATNSYMLFSTYGGTPLNITKGIAAMIINSNNTKVTGLIYTDKPIYYINSTNTNITYNSNTLYSNDNYTIILDSCTNFNVTNNYLVGNNYQVGGDKTVKVIGGENITVKNNKPNLVLVNNETYHKLFDKDGNYIGSEDVLIINSDLHGVDLIFNQYVNITSTNNSTIYGGTIKLTKMQQNH